MALSPAHIGLIKPIRSGFALSPSNPNAREALLQAANGLFLTGAKLVPAENLVPLLIPTVPAFIYTDKGRAVVTHEMLSDEIERVSSVRPTAVKLFGSVNHDAPYRTWLGLFSKAPRPGFREPTHRAGNTLDIVWSNISAASAWVDRDECMTSDHFPISGILPCYTRATNKLKGPLRVSKNKVPLFAHLVSQWIPNVQELMVTEEIEQFAQDVCRALTDALKAVGKASSGGSGSSAPWWTPECKVARLQY
ncbi:hypothetical protein K3495_g3567 [Podosphaera aphanis]|nr:hypothetical protein K3495_g3567 [Podosphaera aphanis]